jgi:prenyltransferase beta subunit
MEHMLKRSEPLENMKSSLLNKFPNLKKTVSFLLNSQNSDGSYNTLKPDPITSMYFLGILYELGKKPKFRTIYSWVKSLQTDHRGFGEATGENSWDYTTYWGSKTHMFLEIRPEFEEDFINFVQSHQNSDGGFGRFVNTPSTLNSTIYWTISLIDLGYHIKNKMMLINYLNNYLKYKHRSLSLTEIYNIIYILTRLKHKIEIKEKIINRLKKYSFIDLEELFYYSFIFRMLGESVDLDKKFILKCQNSDGGFGKFPYSLLSNPRSTYFAIKLLKNMNALDGNIKNKVIGYVHKNELKEGGFINKKDKNTHTLYCCVSALDILGYKPKHLDKLLLWLKYCQNNDGGFGYFPRSQSSEKATYWSLVALKLLDGLGTINKEKLKEYLDRNIMNVNPFSSYYLVGVCEILDVLPSNYSEIIEELLTYQTKDGGFAPIKNTKPEMYETFRAVNAIYSVENILQKNEIPHQSRISEINKKTISWILSCESKNGGFSWIPYEISYIQPTYHALTILSTLNKKIGNTQKHIKWIFRFQNKDGGFNGGIRGTPSDVHFAFWALNSLNILNKKQCRV